MKIILDLLPGEGNREIECEEENIRPAYKEIIRKIEDVCCMHQIRYYEIKVEEKDE